MSKLNIDKTLGVGGIMSVALAAVLGLSDAGTHRIESERKAEIRGGALCYEEKEQGLNCKEGVSTEPGASSCTSSNVNATEHSCDGAKGTQWGGHSNTSHVNPFNGREKCNKAKEWTCKLVGSNYGWVVTNDNYDCGERDKATDNGSYTNDPACKTPTPPAH